MSTHAFIGKRNPTGTVTGVYCHHDGYPSHTGKVLTESYANRLAVLELLDLGDLSFLDHAVSPPPGVRHTFDSRARGATLAYHRDRGEELHPAGTYSTVDDAISCVGASYGYVFERDGSWKTYDRNGKELKDSV